MLWYKAWLETRSRFLISLLGITALCSFIVYHGDREALPYTKLSYYYFVLRSGHAMLCMMWTLAVTLLLMGGLLREKAVGTAAFTLALPASRAHLMRVRIGMGLLEALTLVLVPWGGMYVTAATTGKLHPLEQAWFHIVLLAGGGLVFFGVALLVASLVEGEYTAPAASFGTVLALTIVLGDGPLREYSPYAFVNGLAYFDRYSGMLMGPIPWGHVAVSALIAVALMGASVIAIQRREF